MTSASRFKVFGRCWNERRRRPPCRRSASSRLLGTAKGSFTWRSLGSGPTSSPPPALCRASSGDWHDRRRGEAATVSSAAASKLIRQPTTLGAQRLPPCGAFRISRKSFPPIRPLARFAESPTLTAEIEFSGASGRGDARVDGGAYARCRCFRTVPTPFRYGSAFAPPRHAEWRGKIGLRIEIEALHGCLGFMPECAPALRP